MINVFCFPTSVFELCRQTNISAGMGHVRESVYLFFRVNLLKKRTKKRDWGVEGYILFHIYKFIYQCLTNSSKDMRYEMRVREGLFIFFKKGKRV